MSELESIPYRLRRAKIQEPSMPSEGYQTVLGKEAAATIESLTAELAALKERYRWIPVGERLPEDCKLVLTWDGSWQDTDNLDFDEKEDVWQFRPETTTHWTPLPPPPDQP